MNIITRFGRWALAQFRRVKSVVATDDFFELLKDSAVSAVSYAEQLDLDGNGRSDAVDFVLAVAAGDGVPWGRRFATDVGRTVLANLDDGALRRWHAVAQVTEYIVVRFGPLALPKLSRLNFVVELALALIDDADE
jgi:hypothetical protein